MKKIVLFAAFSMAVLSTGCSTESSIVDPGTGSPYPSTEIFLTYDEIFGNAEPDRVQDFDLTDTDLFVHPIGAFGLYRYHLDSGHSQLLTNYGSGDFIAQDSIYVFYEISGFAIFRYNLEKDSTDLRLGLSGLAYTNIRGMDVYEHILYVLFTDQISGTAFLATFDLEGTFLASVPYSRSTIFIAIHNSVAYSISLPDSGKSTLSRFDLKSQAFLEDRPLPTANWDGIRIFEGKFYFTDFEERYIGRFDMAEVET